MKLKKITLIVLIFLQATLNAQDTLLVPSSAPEIFVRQQNIKHRNGVYKSFYPNGGIRSIEKYKNGKAKGKWKWFHKNGELQLEGKYRSYRKSPIDIVVLLFFNPDKDALNEQNNSSFKSGRWKRYYPNGKLQENSRFKNGEEKGRCRSYYANGNLKFFQRYRNGEERVWKVYYESTGKLNFIERYKNAERVGRWTAYFENGQLEYTLKYNFKGKEIGVWKRFYSNGQLKKIRYVKKNIQKCYDLTGQEVVCDELDNKIKH